MRNEPETTVATRHPATRNWSNTMQRRAPSRSVNRAASRDPTPVSP